MELEDRLRRGLTEEADRAGIPPPVGDVIAPARRRRIGMVVALTLGIVLVVGGSKGISALVSDASDVKPSQSSDRSSDRLSEPAASYRLNGFKIAYPYDRPGRQPPNPDQATASYTADWARGVYPGAAECRMTLFDGDGDVVGSAPFGLDSATDHRHVPQGPPIDITAEPLSVEATCDDSIYEPGPGYVFEFQRVEPSYEGAPGDIRTKVIFRLRWETDVYPSMRTCYMTLKRPDGTTERLGRINGTFGEEGSEVDFSVAGPPESIESAEMTCKPLES